MSMARGSSNDAYDDFVGAYVNEEGGSVGAAGLGLMEAGVGLGGGEDADGAGLPLLDPTRGGARSSAHTNLAVALREANINVHAFAELLPHAKNACARGLSYTKINLGSLFTVPEAQPAVTGSRTTYSEALVRSTLHRVLEKRMKHQLSNTVFKLGVGAFAWQVALLYCQRHVSDDLFTEALFTGLGAMVGLNVAMLGHQKFLQSFYGGEGLPWKVAAQLIPSVTLADGLWQPLTELAAKIAGASQSIGTQLLLQPFYFLQGQFFSAAQNVIHHKGGCLKGVDAQNKNSNGFHSNSDFSVMVGAGAYNSFYIMPLVIKLAAKMISSLDIIQMEKEVVNRLKVTESDAFKYIMFSGLVAGIGTAIFPLCIALGDACAQRVAHKRVERPSDYTGSPKDYLKDSVSGAMFHGVTVPLYEVSALLHKAAGRCMPTCTEEYTPQVLGR
jgi:hypothetical protein